MTITKSPPCKGTGFASAKGKAAVLINRSPQPQIATLPFDVTTEQTALYLANKKTPHMATIQLDGDLAVWEQGPMQTERAAIRGAREVILPALFSSAGGAVTLDPTEACSAAIL